MRIILTTLLLLTGLAIGQTFYESVAPVSLGTADGVNYYTVISGEGSTPEPSGWDDQYSSVRVLWFSTDATNGSGNWTDTGSTNVGTVSGATRTIVGTNAEAGPNADRVEIAYSFDGVDDTITVNKSSDFDVTTDHPSMCWAFWVWPRTVGEGGSGRIIDKAAASTGFLFYLSATSKFNAAWAGGSTLSTTNNAVTMSNWNHIAVVRGNFGLGNTTVNDLGVWINGVLITNQADFGYNADANSTFTVGNGSGGTARTFDGLIDDVRIYTNASFTVSDLSSASTAISNLYYNTRKPDNSNENGY